MLWQAKLRRLIAPGRVSANIVLSVDMRYYLIRASWISGWQRWLKDPIGNDRPSGISNQEVFCHHNLLTIDVTKQSDLRSFVYVNEDEWAELGQMWVRRSCPTLGSHFDDEFTAMRLSVLL